MILVYLWRIGLQGLVLLDLLPPTHTHILCTSLSCTDHCVQAPCRLTAGRESIMDGIGIKLRTERGIVCYIYTAQPPHTFTSVCTLLVGCRLWGRTELDTTEATWRQWYSPMFTQLSDRPSFWIQPFVMRLQG